MVKFLLLSSKSRAFESGLETWFTRAFVSFFLKISGDNRFSYAVRALSNGLGKDLAVPMRETEYIRESLKSNEVDIITY